MKRSFTLSRFLSVAAIAIVMLLAGQSVRAAVTITALNGTGGTGGEGYAKLVDRSSLTKWGHFCFNDDYSYAYVILKTSEPIVPVNYFLVIGNDTEQNPTRNWEDWTISAANFDSDEQAVENANWTVVDERKGELLPTKNKVGADFEFNKSDKTTAYQYYMIKVTRAVNGVTNIFLQMSEFGFGTSEMFFNSAPVTYSVIDGTRNNADNEALNKLFDGRVGSKWGVGGGEGVNWQGENTGAFAIFKATRPMCPTYYKLVTGNDTGSNPGRNWKDYKIYGMNAAKDSDAKRDAEGWVLLDEKHVTEKELPAKNLFSVYMTLSEPNTTKYQYFKLEIESIQGAPFMQMDEFAFGDEAQFVNDREEVYQAALSAVNTDKVFLATLKEAYMSGLSSLNTAADIFSVVESKNSLDALIDSINSSILAYASLDEAVAGIKVHYDNHNCLSDEGKRVLGAYLNETIAPNATYPNGTYPYIVANAVLGVDELAAEVRNVGAMLELYASDMTSGALDVTYRAIAGNEDRQSEGYGMLFDGDVESKWCTGTPAWVVFSASEPIAPTYYRLTTGNDTDKNPGRNWKNWKVYAGNFASDGDATRDAEGWVLIDEKTNVGTDQLPAGKQVQGFLQLSKPSATKYQYFKLEVETLVSGTTQQMSEFAFGNDANRILYRNEQYAEMAAFNTDMLAQRSLVNDYRAALAELKTCTNVSELGTLVRQLADLQGKINSSAELYAKYDSVYNELVANAAHFADYATLGTLVKGYVENNEAPGSTYRNGTHAYIAENCQLDNAGIKAETTYLSTLIASIQDEETTRFIILDGNGQWNDNESWSKLLDNDDETKWGCTVNSSNPPYVIFRAVKPVNPYFYTLKTGGDTESYTGRNWSTWKIYAANFAGDGEATKDADGWVLVDEKTNVGQNRLKPTNNTASYFGFSSETTTEYTYYKLVVEKPFSGDGQQMQELHFGTPEEFEFVREDYKTQANDFNTDVVCEQRLLDRYSEQIEGIDEIVNMEVLFRTYDGIVNLQDSIKASVASYQNYIDAVDALKEYVKQNPELTGAALDRINSYVGDEAIEPSEDLFAQGSYAYIIDERELNDSLLREEISFVESMKRALVAEGYVAGTEITPMVNDPSLAKGGMGWSQSAFSYGTYNGMSAGEFCNEKRIFDIHQTLTGLKDGYYEVRINAAFRPAGDTTSTNYRAIVYANDAQIYAPAVLDDKVDVAQAVDGENCYISGSIPDKAIRDGVTGDTLSYVIWGVNGSCVAFKAGRYENVLVVKVTDGRLTFGMKNEGTPDNANGKGDWSAMGNTRIFYLGNEETDEVNAAFDRALACQAKRAAVLNAYVADDINNFKHTPNFSQAERNAATEAAAAAETATTVAAKAELQATFSALCDQINATKDAYIVAKDGMQKVYDKWMNNTAMVNQSALEADIFDMQDNLLGGIYDEAGALAAKEAIYAKWPDYLTVTNAADMGYFEDEPFSYVITAASSRPYVLATGAYEALDSTKTVLKFEYKSEANLTGSRFYFGTPSLVATQTLDADGFAASSDWKTVYFYIAPALEKWSFGDLEDILRFDLGSDVAEGTLISLRHMQYISKEQADAENAEYTWPTGINNVEEKTAPAVKGIFNLSGQRVSRAVKGIYIINGRKVLVK